MIAYIYIEHDLIGKIDVQLVNKSYKTIGGKIIPAPAYEKYRMQIQQLSSDKGLADESDLPFRIVLENTTPVDPEGGMFLTDMIDSPHDIYMEADGISKEIVERIQS